MPQQLSSKVCSSPALFTFHTVLFASLRSPLMLMCRLQLAPSLQHIKLLIHQVDLPCLSQIGLNAVTGPKLRFHTAATVAICGAAFCVSINGRAQELWRSFEVQQGNELAIGNVSSFCLHSHFLAGLPKVLHCTDQL